MAGEQPKRATGGSFGQFLTENRAALIKELPGQKATAAVKLASTRFKALSEVAKAKYQKMYEAAKQKYEKDLAAFLKAGGVVAARKSKKDKDGKKKKTKDANKPKKPAGGAFGCFLAKKRAEFMKELGPGKAVTAVTKLASEKWKKVSEAEKAPFQKEYEAKAAVYKKAMETYVPPAVEEEDEEAEEDEEDEEDEEEDDDEEEEEDSPKKRKADTKKDAPAAKKGKNDAPAAKKGKAAGAAEVEAEAKKLGFSVKLKTLSDNPKVKSSPAEILAELQKQKGSVIGAKKALLGA